VARSLAVNTSPILLRVLRDKELLANDRSMIEPAPALLKVCWEPSFNRTMSSDAIASRMVRPLALV